MNWGHGIAIFFTCYVGFMLFLVVKSYQQNIDLVTENYYEQELQFQDHIDRVRNTRQLKETLHIAPEKDRIRLSFPDLDSPILGSVQVFRPSDASFDLQEDLQPDSVNRHYIATNSIPPGFYRVKVSWQSGEQDYYSEEALHLK